MRLKNRWFKAFGIFCAIVLVLFVFCGLMSRTPPHSFEKSNLQNPVKKVLIITDSTGDYETISRAVQELLAEKKIGADMYFCNERRTDFPNSFPKQHRANINRIIKKNKYDGIIGVTWDSSLLNLDANVPRILIAGDAILEQNTRIFDSPESYLILASDELAESARKVGFSDEKIIQVPLMPIRPMFFKDVRSQSKAREELNLPACDIVLVMLEPSVLHDAEDIMEAVKDFDEHFVFVCGRNKKLYDHLAKLNKEKYENRFDVHESLKNMHRWMQASNVLIGQCGGGTVGTLIASKVVLVSNKSTLSAQERRNFDFLAKNSMAINVRKYSKHDLKQAISLAKRPERKNSFAKFNPQKCMKQFRTRIIRIIKR